MKARFAGVSTVWESCSGFGSATSGVAYVEEGLSPREGLLGRELNHADSPTAAAAGRR
jgi:hypothetical protein